MKREVIDTHNPEPKVSVLMITYNHEAFIDQAVESALSQDAGFPYEIVVGDDKSSDGTREILLSYQAKFPGKIRLLLHERNLGQGGKANFAETLWGCRGEYIALLEGDDYWTSPHKLRKQVDFLNAHPECVSCFHPAQFVDEQGKELPQVAGSNQLQRISTVEDLLITNFMPTASVMFRADALRRLPDWFFTLLRGDWAIHVLVAKHGSIGRLGEIMAAYRFHQSGFWSSVDSEIQILDTIREYRFFDEYLNFRHSRFIKELISREYCILGGVHLLKHEWLRAAKCLARSFVMSPFNRHIPRIQLLSKLVKKGSTAGRTLLSSREAY
ncbi:MAG: glycosyltransferase family 2 protein [Thermodesulfobacteriota bacterium]